MISWVWLIPTSMISAMFGFLVFSLFAINADNEYDYDTWQEKHRK